MVLEVIENLLLSGIIGFVIGIVAARVYFKTRLQMKNIGQLIEYAMIEKNIRQLEILTTSLNRLIVDLKESSEELGEQIKMANDIEMDVRPKIDSDIEELDLVEELQVYE
jgi:hypothetical protein